MGFDERSVYALQMAVDEACSNIIRHAYGGEGRGNISLQVEQTTSGVKITIEDNGTPFNPDIVPKPDIEAPLEARGEGGLGLFLIRQLMDEVSFEFGGGPSGDYQYAGPDQISYAMTESTPSPLLPEPDMKVLENRWLHKVFVFISSFDQYPKLLDWLLLLGCLGLHYGLWYLSVPQLALPMTVVLAGAMGLDLALLWWLPRRGISFGRVASQFVSMSLPRVGVAAVSLLLALWQPTAALWLMIGLQAVGVIVYLWAMLVEPHRLAMTTLHLTTPHLPSDATPVRLLHLSDLHVERLTRREQRVLDLIESVQPDLIVITGDYLNLSYTRDAEAIAQVRSLLAKIDAPFGVYATLGSPPVDVADVAPYHFAESHIQLLREDLVEVDLGAGRRLALLGMDCSHDMVYDAHRLAAVDAGRNGRLPTVLLYHSPELMPSAQQYEIDLFLCGHTHGGQVRVPGYGAIVTSSVTGKRYEMGRYDENGTTLYVSRGVGLEGMCAPRLRLFCPPEITLVTLTGE